MDDRDVTRRRLCNQRLSTPALETPGEVVAWLGAVQAQDYRGALWAVGLRLRGATEQAVEQAVADRTIVRTWPMRGTLHFVAPEDVRWMLALLTPRVLAGSGRRRKQLELDDATCVRAEALFTAALRDGTPRTRPDLMAVLEQGGIATGGQRGYHLLWWAAQRGLICFGPRQGNQDSFVLLDAWLPEGRRLSRDASLAELASRYFTSHGPAAVQDFMWWSGLRAADARAGLAMAASHSTLAHAERDGRTYWFSPAGPAPNAAPPDAFLLPGFDEYLLGYTDRRAVLDPAHAGRVVPGGNGVFRPVVVLDGRVVGTWKRTLRKTRVQIALDPFEPLHPAQAERLAPAVEPYGRFLGLPVEHVR